MQLILHSEPALAVEKDMSTVENTQTEKVGNGAIGELNEKKIIGNKENLGDVNCISNDDISKPTINEDSVESSLTVNQTIKSENKDEDTTQTSTVDTVKEICVDSNLEVNNTQEEESQKKDTEEISSTDGTNSETENKLKEIKQEDSNEDGKDILMIKEENVNQIFETVEKELESIVPKNDETTIKEEFPITKDDVDLTKKPTEGETIADVELEEIVKEPETIDNKELEPSENDAEIPVCKSPKVVSCNDDQDSESVPIELKDDIDEDVLVEETKSNTQDTKTETKDLPPTPVNSIIDKPILCKLSNTLDILSDDEEEPPKEEPPVVLDPSEKQCINIEDDDDIMLIDEDTSKTETKPTQPVDVSDKDEPMKAEVQTDSETGEKTVEESSDLFAKTEEKEIPPTEINDTSPVISINEKEEETTIKKPDLPLLPDNFLKTAKKNLSDMTREDLEEFCILKIVESIVDRSNLSEIKNKLKTMAQGIEEYRKKAMMLTKQNRDLQVVLKSVQEEQKKMTPGTAITPLKITRSVGMQVFMEKSGARRKSLAQLQNPNTNNIANRQNVRNASTPSPRPQKPPAPNQPIPVPRLVPANNPTMKTPSTIPLVNQITPSKTASPIPNGIKTPSPSQKVAEKRQHNRIMSVTVDLTDDEPPAKLNNNRTSPAPPVRLVPPQNLLASPRQAFGSTVSSPRKVYIPISGPQSQGIRPGQTIMLKTVPSPGIKPRGPSPQMSRVPSGTVRVNRIQTGRHPAPLPDAMKQYQPPNWKALPPAPDLKLSKVENGIVISWKIEGYQEDSYEEIASYQLYAYQETSSPASTALWKKIGDVKALPLPMACTLTQFMAGFKYYFAVRAVDIRSRLGPFSLPGSILLLNKL